MRTSTKLKIQALKGRAKSELRARKAKRQEKEKASRRTYSYTNKK